MKTVQTHVLSADPISTSDATSFLSSFSSSVFSSSVFSSAAAASGSHETSWFVRRALASFEELDLLHRKLSGTHNLTPQSFVSSLSKPESQRRDEFSYTKAGEVKKEEKKTNKERQNSVDESEMRSEAAEKKEKKKRKIEVLENGEGGAATGEEQSEKKKKRKKS